MKKNPKIKFRISNFEFRSCAPVIGMVLALVGVGCGYQFSGKGAEFPQDVRSVFIAPFVNATEEVGVDREVTSVLKSEFRQKGELRVATRLEDADAILSGVLRSLEARVVSVNKNDAALQYEVTLVVDMSLRRRSPDELLWRTQGIRLVEVYGGSRGAVVTTSSEFKRGTLNASDVPQFIDIQLTETLGHKARGQLIERFARKLHQMLIEMF